MPGCTAKHAGEYTDTAYYCGQKRLDELIGQKGLYEVVKAHTAIFNLAVLRSV